MQTLYNNPDWTFIINFSSIFLGVLSILLTFRLSFEKELGLIIWETSTIYENILSDRDSRKQLHKLDIAFQNFGKYVIFKNDLLNDIKIELQNVIAIKNISFESNCKFNSINHSVKNESILFNFDFLEGHKYIKAHIEYYSEENILVNIRGKIIGGNEIKTIINSNTTWEKSYRIGEKDARAKIFVFPFITLVLVSLSFQVFLKMFNLDNPNLNRIFSNLNKDSFVTTLIGIIIIFACILVSNFLTKFFIPYATFMKREKKWYSK